MQRILVAGGTGSLGRHVIGQLKEQGYWIRALVRRPERLGAVRGLVDEVVPGDLTKPKTLTGVCDGMDLVFSSAGAALTTSLRDRKSFAEVDGQGNLNLLDEARRAGIGRFVYVSLCGAERLAGVEYADAHESVVRALAASGLDHTVVRPTGFFSAFAEFLKIAKQGFGLVIGSGECRTNPIHEAELAAVCVQACAGREREVLVGGPASYTRRQVVELAFAALGKRPLILDVAPQAFASFVAPLRYLNPRLHALMSFGAAVSQIEVVAPSYGQRDLKQYYEELVRG